MAMLVKLQDLRQGPREYDVRLSPAELHLTAEGFEFPTPVAANVRFQLFGEKVRATGRLETEVAVECSRCLKPLRKTISTPVALVFEKRPSAEEDPRSLMEKEWDAEKRGIEYYDEELVDATEPFRQLILLELPNHPLCRKNCRGLCPHCGADLNQGPCRCETEETPAVGEPEWKAALRKMRLG
jgi:uncharacterized protein